MTNAEAHMLARDKGISGPLYALARALLIPFFRIWFRLRSCGADHVPDEGPAIVAPNHKSAWDPFLVGACSGRKLRFMAKAELFEGRLLARLLVRLGAFPVRRGASDADALETARTVLRQGELLALFPEGRVVKDPECLGMPKRGVGRLALETGAPVVPTALSGTGGLGALPGPRRVRVAFTAPVMVHEMTATPEAAGELVERMVWPHVEEEFRRLRERRRRRLGLSGRAS